MLEIPRRQRHPDYRSATAPCSHNKEFLDYLSILYTNNTAVISYALIWKAAAASQDSDEFINDPRHPRFASGGKFIDLEKRD